MKKIGVAIIALLTISSILFISISGCKKEAKQQTGLKLKTETQIRSISSPGVAGFDFGDISINSYGFLVFPAIRDLEEFKNFLEISTHQQVQDYLKSINFNSLGAVMYTQNLNSTVTHEQAMDYVRNGDGIFQLEDVIMKPVEKGICSEGWRFLLTMTSGNLSSGSYNNMSAGTYDHNTMDKFATNSDQATGLFDFIGNTPTGYEETTSNMCPSYASARPFWGEGHVCHNLYVPDAGGGWRLIGSETCTRYYIFWIPITDEYGCQQNNNLDCAGNPI